MHRLSKIIALVAWAIAPPAFSQSFVNFETPHVSPLDITPDGSKLLAVNTADNRLEVFALSANGPIHVQSIPVGLEPVSVRARTNTEAWVVNHLSDSVSVVDLTSDSRRVKATITVGDEPTDVVFAGTPARAFVCLSQLNQIKVYDPASLAQIGGPIQIQGEDPRALVTDGVNVYAAIFESGNGTTILSQPVVSSGLNPYPGAPNPPPNNGSPGNFDPPLAPGLPTPPAAALILKKSGSMWLDDNNPPADWSAAVGWDLHDHDVAVINANSLAVSYVDSLMNLNMAMALRPDGQISVVGTDAINHVRFEPNVNGVFVRSIGATFTSGGGGSTIVDLNPHLDYSTSTVPQAQRDLSIGDPRGIVWVNADRGYITGMGSNNVIAVNSSFDRIDQIEVGQGPTGISHDAARGLLYVLNKFDATMTVINEASLSVVNTVSIYDPTPGFVKAGRPFLYDTHRTSGLGQASCASCHVDGRLDQLAWDLGDPSGQMKTFNQTCQFPGACENWHPMKGPMTTQTLVGIGGTGPLHWRGDRENLAAFNPAFVGLLGDDVQLTTEEMTQFNTFISSIRMPPQPNRNFDNSLPTTFPNGGNPLQGQTRFQTQLIDGGALTCVSCHALPTGTNGQITPAAALQEPQSFKVPQLRNMYEKTGFFANSSNNNRGFGFLHDGSVDTLFEFLQAGVFQFSSQFGNPDQQRRDIEAFLHCFPTGTHAGVGVQTTVLNGSPGSVPPQQQTLINNMISLANSNAFGLVVKGRQNGLLRGYRYNNGGNLFQSDRAAETITPAALLASAAPGSELTYTVVPLNSQTRIGIDRDLDGFFDQDEVDACADPADPLSTPGNTGNCPADVAPFGKPDGLVNVDDLLFVINNWNAAGKPGTVPGDAGPGCGGDGVVNVDDLLTVISAWGPCP